MFGSQKLRYNVHAPALFQAFTTGFPLYYLVLCVIKSMQIKILINKLSRNDHCWRRCCKRATAPNERCKNHLNDLLCSNLFSDISTSRIENERGRGSERETAKNDFSMINRTFHILILNSHNHIDIAHFSSLHRSPDREKKQYEQTNYNVNTISVENRFGINGKSLS